MLMSRPWKILAPALCGSVRIGLPAPLFSLLAVSASFAQAPPLPAFQETAKSPNFKDGKVVLEERRIRAYSYLGGNENIIRQTLQRIVRQEGDAPGGWVYEWSVLGKFYEGRAHPLLEPGRREGPADHN